MLLNLSNLISLEYSPAVNTILLADGANEYVLGIEAAEGTDELIKRCSNYKKKGDKGILLKLSKYNQNSNLDIPVIGLKTVKLLKKHDFEGIFLEKDKCIVLQKKEVIEFCNKNKLFVLTIIKS